MSGQLCSTDTCRDTGINYMHVKGPLLNGHLFYTNKTLTIFDVHLSELSLSTKMKNRLEVRFGQTRFFSNRTSFLGK